MRREGFELTVGRPRVVFRTDEATGERLEPIEEVIVDVEEAYTGIVVQKLSERRAEMKDMRPSGTGRQRIVFHAPTRGLIGYQSELLSDTRGTAVMNRIFHAYAPYVGEIPTRHTGALLSNSDGEAVAYAIFNLQDRGPMFIDPGTWSAPNSSAVRTSKTMPPCFAHSATSAGVIDRSGGSPSRGAAPPRLISASFGKYAGASGRSVVIMRTNSSFDIGCSA